MHLFKKYLKRKEKKKKTPFIYIHVSIIFFFFFFFSSAVSGGKIIVSNLPAHARFEDIEPLLTTYGQVKNVEKLSSRDLNSQTVLVSYETQEQAQQYVYYT